MAKKRDGCDVGMNEDEDDFPRLLPPVCESEFADNHETEEIKRRKNYQHEREDTQKAKSPKRSL